MLLYYSNTAWTLPSNRKQWSYSSGVFSKWSSRFISYKQASTQRCSQQGFSGMETDIRDFRLCTPCFHLHVQDTYMYAYIYSICLDMKIVLSLTSLIQLWIIASWTIPNLKSSPVNKNFNYSHTHIHECVSTISVRREGILVLASNK